MKNKFVIYLSIFLSIGCAIFSSQNRTVTRTTGSNSLNVAEFDRNFTPRASRSEEEPIDPAEVPVVLVAASEPVPDTNGPGEFGKCPDAILKANEAWNCWHGLLEKYDWNVDTAFKVLYCESQGHKSARNRSGSKGLMQIILKNSSFDPETNMQQANAKYTAAHGWSPWNASKRCWQRFRQTYK